MIHVEHKDTRTRLSMFSDHTYVDQFDHDSDGKGNTCDDDMDDDGVPNDADNCPKHHNRVQKDSDGDGIGDACDNCRSVSNQDQEDTNFNNIGNACDSREDRDDDGIPDNLDNCINKANADQIDTDKVGLRLTVSISSNDVDYYVRIFTL